MIAIATPRTPQQNARLHTLISTIYPVELREEMKEECAMRFSNGRTKHTSELCFQECSQLLNELQATANALQQRNAAKQRQHTQRVQEETPPQLKKCFAIMRSLRWDYADLSGFIKKQTAGAKHHTKQLTPEELNKLVTAMEGVETYNFKRNT